MKVINIVSEISEVATEVTKKFTDAIGEKVVNIEDLEVSVSSTYAIVFKVVHKGKVYTTRYDLICQKEHLIYDCDARVDVEDE